MNKIIAEYLVGRKLVSLEYRDIPNEAQKEITFAYITTDEDRDPVINIELINGYQFEVQSNETIETEEI